MSSTLTLAEVAARVRDLADQPTTGGFAVNARVYEYINQGMANLWGDLVTASEDYGRSVDTVTLVSGTEEYAIPSDYLKTLKVFALSGGQRYRLRRFTLNDLEHLQDGTAGVILADGTNLQYRIIGKKLWVTPKPTGGTIEHWYVPEAPQYDVTNTADVIDTIFPVGWPDYITTFAAFRLLVREDSSAAAGIGALHSEAKRAILEQIGERDLGEPHVVSDAYRRWSPIY